MKLSTRARYGIHAMFDLAQFEGCGPQTLRSIAERQMVPEQYLEQIIGPLRREGLVSSVRGVQGGYMLARPARAITVGEVLRTLEGPLAMTDCLIDIDSCARASACPSRLVWERLSNRINEVLDGITLQDMMDDQPRHIAAMEGARDGKNLS